MRHYSDNIKKLLLINFLVGFVFWYGIEKTFLSRDLHIGAEGVAAIVVTYVGVQLVFDVPLGILADRWSRKYTLFLCAVFFAASDIVLGTASNFSQYLAGTVLWGLYTVSIMGTNEAMTYDSLKELGRESEYRRTDSTQRIGFMVGIFVSSFASGFMATALGMRSTYFLSVVPLILAAVIALTLKEPSIHDAKEHPSFFGHARATFQALALKPVLLRLTSMTIVVMLIQNVLYEYSQYYYLALFGSVIIAGILNGTTGLFLALGYKLSPRVTRFQPLFIVAGGLLLLAGAGKNPLLILVFAATYPLVAITENGTMSAIQHHTPSNIRASLTSAIHFVGNCVLVPLTIAFAFLVEHQSIMTAYQYSGAVIVVVGIVFLFDKSHLKRDDVIKPNGPISELVAK